MLNFIIRRLAYGLLVLWGVVSLIFLIFNSKPGDPARMMGGQHASPEVIEAIRKDLGLDLPLYNQYLLYMNDLSVVSVLNNTNPESYLYNDPDKYSIGASLKFGDNYILVLKTPYLRRSYQSRKKVSEIIAEAFPGTVLL